MYENYDTENKSTKTRKAKNSKLPPTVNKVIVIALSAFVGLFLISTIFSSFYIVNENENAVVTTFGVPQAVTSSGLKFKIPFIQEVQKVDVTIKGFPIGYDSATNQSILNESLMITSDFNFVCVDFYLEYQVTDPVKYLYASENPVIVLKDLAQSYIRDTVGLYDVDSVITTGKSEIQSKIKTMLMDQLDSQNIGIQLVNITIQDAEPPTEAVKEAFKAVETAKQGKETAINNAKKYRSEQIPQAEAQVDQIKKQAEAEKEARINEANGQAARFNALYEEYI
jgi:membrane protease subunit HflK